MPRARLFFLTLLAMTAFAGNSLLCRLALKHTAIDPVSFTSLRLASGALTLWLIVRWTQTIRSGHGNWRSAAALFVYALAFSLAYVQLSAATGALLLFGAVQATMIGHGLWAGERLRPVQGLGCIVALGGLGSLLLPGLTTPPWGSAALMASAGLAWGIYSLRGKGSGDATRVTAGNFARTVPMAVTASLLVGVLPLGLTVSLDAWGMINAIASGALASGVGYAIWYSVLPSLKSVQAASVQLSVPVIAALGGILFLGETVGWRLVIASVAILGGIALVIRDKNPSKP